MVKVTQRESRWHLRGLAERRFSRSHLRWSATSQAVKLLWKYSKCSEGSRPAREHLLVSVYLWAVELGQVT